MAQTITMPIPAGLVVITETDNELLQEAKTAYDPLLGLTWGMDDLRNHLLKKATWWVRQEILDKYRDELDVDNDGFVKYPISNRTPWRMKASAMAAFLDENWNNFDWNAKRKVGY